ncbi:response regulator transcription factor [Pandoraea sputorum]|uniref:response regulator transcription factor n=1 Tax=Pandoraea sputorum TaxID=93222 RepID=UPI002AF6BA0A|nr:response regulator transcription factor [Pandoraea sputorum]
MRVLLVEDDPLITSGIVAGLSTLGIHVEASACGEAAMAAHAENSFDALVLDLGLPDGDGLDLIASVRAVEPDIPVLILTARDGIEYRISGLNAGADDYMSKPFDLRELAARLHALVRRTHGRAAQVIEAGPLRLDPASGLAWLEGEPVELSRREVDLLAYLASSRGRWLSPDMLHVRLYGMTERVNSNVLNVHIHNVRRKLGCDAIQTARGLGYRLGWSLS